MKLTEFYARVAKKSDMAKLEINAAETSRVCAVFFDELLRLSTDDAQDTLAKGLATAAKRKAAAKAKKKK
jgi:hypothetical protein